MYALNPAGIPQTACCSQISYVRRPRWWLILAGPLQRNRFGNRLNHGDFICTVLYRGVMATLETLKFDNLALRSLPIDKETQNVIRQVEGACFTLVDPTPVRNPSLVSCSLNALSLLDLSQSEVTRPEFVQYMSGNKLLGGSQTAAHCYCGHQQGYFSGQLGDGAAM